MVAPLYFPFLLIHVYIPFFYPFLMVILLTLQSRHPYILYVFEIKKKYPKVLFKQMVIIIYQMMMCTVFIIVIHYLVFITNNIDILLIPFVMINISTLFMFGLFNPITTTPFYKLFGFLVIFVGHHFLLDLDVYRTFTFLYREPNNFIQIFVLLSGYIILQIIHYVSLEKKVF
jgi:hypothetical protein